MVLPGRCLTAFVLGGRVVGGGGSVGGVTNLRLDP